MPLIYDEEAGAFIDAPTPLVNVGGGMAGEYRTSISR